MLALDIRSFPARAGTAPIVVFVAESPDRTVRYGKLVIAAETLPEDYPRGMIRSIDVHPHHRRQGVATALLDHARQTLPYPVRHSHWQTAEGQAWAEATDAHSPTAAAGAIP